MTTNIRAVALTVLDKCTAAGQYSNIALDTALKRNPLSPADRGLLTSLVYGTLEHLLTLDHFISALSSRGIDEIDGQTRNLLRMGLYQLAFLDRIPDHAAVNETVDLAPKRTRGFVNAILRAFLRADKKIALPDRDRDPIAYLSVRYSFAPAICEKFLSTFGFDRTERLLEAFCQPPTVTLRVNTLKTTRETLLRELTAQGFAAEATLESPHGILLRGNAPVPSLPGFSDGLFFVQDEASQLCTEALDARAGMNVIDVCACPGSKSFGIAASMENSGRLLSCDLHQNKLSLVRSGAERLSISIIETVARDAREPNHDWIGAYDRVLCDVPCSGFGVFAKKPELRYKNPDESAGLPEIQSAILRNASTFLRAGGLLVYSTCTLLPEENQENIARFLQTSPDFSLLTERTLTPDVDGTDGFYFAVLQKR
ncbi:MAG: 16S rRNA (cytosine(967)-C(5))-methyltransferase RsmB [Clostridia bacterium]|nr:16S rRNA (cytosine(967)-C(5))-methyltransferase RsmB [Clostridia bacterium]